jgi:hypothetical protein
LCHAAYARFCARLASTTGDVRGSAITSATSRHPALWFHGPAHGLTFATARARPPLRWRGRSFPRRAWRFGLAAEVSSERPPTFMRRYAAHCFSGGSAATAL